MSNSTEYFQYERREVSGLLPTQYSKVLEIGCGTGQFRNNLNQEHEYWGVEPVEFIAKLAKEKLDKVLVGTYQEVENLIPNNYFDLVICNDVIEHMPDDDSFLQSIKQKIKKDGCLVASIPNVRYILNLWELLIKKDWQYKSAGLLDRKHLRFFTRKSLVRTLNNNAFSIKQITGINRYKPQSLRNRMLYILAVLLLGSDIQYLQFGIRAICLQPSNT